MKKHSRRVAACAAVVFWASIAAAQPAASDPQSQDSLVREALSRYQAGLDALKSGGAPVPSSADAQAGRPIRDIRLSDVVEIGRASCRERV